MSANEVPMSKSLNIKQLRRRWQIIILQLISTASLILLMQRMTRLYGTCSDSFIESYGDSLYWCPAYEHTRGLRWFEQETGSLVLPDFLTGLDQTGEMTVAAPLILCFAITAAWIYALTRGDSTRKWINIGAAVVFFAWMLLPFLISWITALNHPLNHIDHLWGPLLFVFELVFLGVVFAPVLAGIMGIWGLSKKFLTWTVGYYLTVIGVHAILTFEGITESVDLGLNPLPGQIGEATMWGGLVSPLALDMIEIAILLLLYLESGSAVISHMEYASLLPKDAKRDPDFVRQFENVVNGHLVHLIGVMSLVALTTAIALEFDDFLISTVGALSGGQWSGQVKESLELQLTYGKVISAGLFLVVVAGMRFILPWQRVTGIFETALLRFRSTET